MVKNAVDNADIDECLKANKEGLALLKEKYVPQYNKIERVVTARRQELKVDTFVDDFLGGDEIPGMTIDELVEAYHVALQRAAKAVAAEASADEQRQDSVRWRRTHPATRKYFTK